MIKSINPVTNWTVPVPGSNNISMPLLQYSIGFINVRCCLYYNKCTYICLDMDIKIVILQRDP